MAGDSPQNVLVIRLGALGDFVLSLGPMAAIRRHHPGATLTLLTTEPFRQIGEASGYFDDVWTGGRPKRFSPSWFRLAKRLRAGRFDMVYDLQTSGRSLAYYRIMRGVAWSGHARGARYRDANPDRDRLHTIDRQAGQLAVAGIEEVPAGDLSWLTASVEEFDLSGDYVLLVPGGSSHRPAKRWPSDRYANLARRLLRQGRTPVLIGGPDEASLLAGISAADHGIINLCGQTRFDQIAVLARRASASVGNDTGPMHLIAMAGCPSVVLFSAASDPALCAPRPGLQGGQVSVLRRKSLSDLDVETVFDAVADLDTRLSHA